MFNVRKYRLECSTFNITNSFKRVANAHSYESVLSEVPWLKFKIIAEPDMSIFSRDHRLQAFITEITETSINSVTEQIMGELNTRVEQLIQGISQVITERMSTVRDTVIDNITSMSASVSTMTEFQTLEVKFVAAQESVGGKDARIRGGRLSGEKRMVADRSDSSDVESTVSHDEDAATDRDDISSRELDLDGEAGNARDQQMNNKTSDENSANGSNNCDYPPTTTPNFPGVSPEDGNLCIVDPPILNSAQWIWTNEVLINATPARSTRPFRKTVELECPVNCATVCIACDNFYTLYVNGKLVGSGTDWYRPDCYTVRFEPTRKVVFAVYAAQDTVSGGPVGLIAAGRVWNGQDKCPMITDFVTDRSWKTMAAEDFDFDFVVTDFGDCDWQEAYVEAPYGQGVWNLLEQPKAGGMPRTGLVGIPGVIDAPEADEAEVLVG